MAARDATAIERNIMMDRGWYCVSVSLIDEVDDDVMSTKFLCYERIVSL